MWYSFDVVDGHPRDPDGIQWHAFNPDYDPGPLPPPRLPREVKASMIITTKSHGEVSSATKARRNENRSQPYKSERNPYLETSTSQQSPAAEASGSTQQPRPQRQRTYNPHSQHQPVGARRGSSAPWRVGTTSSGLSSDVGNGWEQPTEQAQVEKGYPNHPPRRKSSRPSRQPASQDANNS